MLKIALNSKFNIYEIIKYLIIIVPFELNEITNHHA